MPASLSPQLYLAVLGEDAVLLDLSVSDYLCVPLGGAALSPSPCRRMVAPPDPAVLADLRGAGLVVDGPPGGFPPPPPRPARHLLDAPARRLTARERVRLGLCLWDVLRRYWRRPLADILDFADREGQRLAEGDDPARLADLSAAALRALVWAPLPPKCLIRSFVVLRFLHRSGLRARWVLGVRTWPFSAHCWLQADDVVLDDAAERLLVYEPIVAVG